MMIQKHFDVRARVENFPEIAESESGGGDGDPLMETFGHTVIWHPGKAHACSEKDFAHRILENQIAREDANANLQKIK